MDSEPSMRGQAEGGNDVAEGISVEMDSEPLPVNAVAEMAEDHPSNGGENDGDDQQSDEPAAVKAGSGDGGGGYAGDRSVSATADEVAVRTSDGTVYTGHNQVEYWVDQEGIKGIDGRENTHAQSEQVASAIHVVSMERDASFSDVAVSLADQIKKLEREIREERETRMAAEVALQHLNATNAEAESRIQELSLKLTEALQSKKQEKKESDEKYVELDAKLQRLLKRAKQRIQELQKEKDELEARFNDVNPKLEEATSQRTLAQQELERARQQASEALRAMDVERQQLRSANNKLRDNLDEMRRTLETKSSALEKLQQSIVEKEQILEQTQRSLQVAEEKRHAAIREFSDKHQKQVETLGAQLAEAVAERNKAAETISSLQMMLAERDSEITEIEAASTGEAARLRAALEEMKGELVHLKDQHEEEKRTWEIKCEAYVTKLEASEHSLLQAEMEFGKIRSQLEMQFSTQTQLLQSRDTELAAANNEISRLQSEFSAYKVRAHALLQKKDAEITAARSSDVLKAQEEALKEAEREVSAALAEKDKAVQDLQDALSRHAEEISVREVAIAKLEQQFKSTAKELDSVKSRHAAEIESLKRNLDSLEESWRIKFESLKAQQNSHAEGDTQKNLVELKSKYAKLKEEHETFRDIADRSLEEKERELTKLLEENKSLRHSMEKKELVSKSDKEVTAYTNQDAQAMGIAMAEQQILLLARQQAQREEELAQSHRQILALQQEIEELEHENRLHSQQEAMLKSELREMERSQKREGIDMTYLKNVILKLLETGEVEACLPVVSMLLQFSPEEVKKCQNGLRARVVQSSLSPEVGSPQSFFSRFTF